MAPMRGKSRQIHPRHELGRPTAQLLSATESPGAYSKCRRRRRTSGQIFSQQDGRHLLRHSAERPGVAVRVKPSCTFPAAGSNSQKIGTRGYSAAAGRHRPECGAADVLLWGRGGAELFCWNDSLIYTCPGFRAVRLKSLVWPGC